MIGGSCSVYQLVVYACEGEEKRRREKKERKRKEWLGLGKLIICKSFSKEYESFGGSRSYGELHISKLNI